MASYKNVTNVKDKLNPKPLRKVTDVKKLNGKGSKEVEDNADALPPVQSKTDMEKKNANVLCFRSNTFIVTSSSASAVDKEFPSLAKKEAKTALNRPLVRTFHVTQKILPRDAPMKRQVSQSNGIVNIPAVRRRQPAKYIAPTNVMTVMPSATIKPKRLPPISALGNKPTIMANPKKMLKKQGNLLVQQRAAGGLAESRKPTQRVSGAVRNPELYKRTTPKKVNGEKTTGRASTFGLSDGGRIFTGSKRFDVSYTIPEDEAKKSLLERPEIKSRKSTIKVVLNMPEPSAPTKDKLPKLNPDMESKTKAKADGLKKSKAVVKARLPDPMLLKNSLIEPSRVNKLIYKNVLTTKSVKPLEIKAMYIGSQTSFQASCATQKSSDRAYKLKTSPTFTVGLGHNFLRPNRKEDFTKLFHTSRRRHELKSKVQSSQKAKGKPQKSKKPHKSQEPQL